MPKWFTANGHVARVHGYDALLRHRLRTRYMELEGRFRGIIENYRTSEYVDETTAVQIANHLWSARDLLENDRSDTYTVSDTLDLAERYMVWVMPKGYHDTMLLTLETRIDGLPEPVRARYEDELARLRPGDDWDSYRSLISEVSRLDAQRVAAEAIDRGLQVMRLQGLRNWGVAVVAAFLLGTPLAANRGSVTDIPGVSSGVVGVWLTGLAVALVSAAAAYLSGLLQVREARVDLVQYQISKIRLQLRPIVGSIISLALFVLLSWNIVPGVMIDSRGSLFLVAFLAGFSERYFLRLLELRIDDEIEQPLQPEPPAR